MRVVIVGYEYVRAVGLIIWRNYSYRALTISLHSIGPKPRCIFPKRANIQGGLDSNVWKKTIKGEKSALGQTRNVILSPCSAGKNLVLFKDSLYGFLSFSGIYVSQDFRIMRTYISYCDECYRLK